MSGIFAMAGAGSGGGGGGGGSGSVTLNNVAVDAQNTGAASSASWRIDSDGYTYEGLNGTYSRSYQWTGDAVANYEVRATLNSGTASGSAFSTWLACSTDRDWTTTDSTANGAAASSNITIEVRDAATLIVKASCTVSLFAERI